MYPKYGAPRTAGIEKQWQFLAAKLADRMEQVDPNITAAKIIAELKLMDNVVYKSLDHNMLSRFRANAVA